MQPISFPGLSTEQSGGAPKPEPATRSGPSVHVRDETPGTQPALPTQWYWATLPRRPENAESSSAPSSAAYWCVVDENPDGLSPLMLAVRKGDLGELEALLAKPGTEIDQFDAIHDLSPLIYAVMKGHVKLAAALLDAGADVNFSSPESGQTALMQATEKGRVECISLLLAQKGIAVDSTDCVGETALMLAVDYCVVEAVPLLLRAGASTAVFTRDAYGAKDFELVLGCAGLTEAFLDQGVPLDSGEPDFLSPDACPHAAAVADLCAAQKMPVPAALATCRVPDLLDILFADLRRAEMEQAVLKWLLGKGMRAAAALQVLRVLWEAETCWKEKPASTAQRKSLYLSALSGLPLVGANQRALDYYRWTGISERSIERLGPVAIAHMEELAALAADHLATVGAEMTENLLDHCIAHTGLDGVAEAGALSAILRESGFCAPVVNAVTMGWQCALTAIGKAPACSVGAAGSAGAAGSEQSMEASRRHIPEHAPAVFSRELLRQLATSDRLAELRASTDGCSAGVLDAQFQIQCDQLRQYCGQLPEASDSGGAAASKD